VIVDIKDGNWDTLSMFRIKTLQISRGNGYIVYKAISTTERSPRVMSGWAAANGESFDT
jgi:hypothetical protein